MDGVCVRLAKAIENGRTEPPSTMSIDDSIWVDSLRFHMPNAKRSCLACNGCRVHHRVANKVQTVDSILFGYCAVVQFSIDLLLLRSIVGRFGASARWCKSDCRTHFITDISWISVRYECRFPFAISFHIESFHFMITSPALESSEWWFWRQINDQ